MMRKSIPPRGAVAITDDMMRHLPLVDRDICDAKMIGLVLRVRASGLHSWRVRYARGRWETLGRADALTPAEARKLARRVFGQVANGVDPAKERRKRTAGTLRVFMAKHYEPWANANHKRGRSTVERIEAVYPDDILDMPLATLTAWHIERWRTQRRHDGISDVTINRDLDALRSVLSKAVLWEIIADHPMRKVRRAKVDVLGRLRYLSADEEQRLRKALEARDESRREGRRSFNAWRRERGYRELPELGTYPDHMTPVVLLALNSGLRRGELLGLEWSDIDLVARRLTVRGIAAKTGLTRHLPLNDEAVTVLEQWRACTKGDDWVFPGPDGDKMFSLKTAWKTVLESADVVNFTFHDLRHTFASKLVQRGVDLNTVRELLGHADIKMTLRYAHLSPGHHAAAVAKLVT